MSDIHGQLMPVISASHVNLGVGAAKGLPPHLTGTDFSGASASPKVGAAYA